MNKPKYYGWQSYVIDASKIQPTSLDFVQYITNTTTIDNELPAVYNLKTSSGKELYSLQGKYFEIEMLVLIWIKILDPPNYKSALKVNKKY